MNWFAYIWRRYVRGFKFSEGHDINGDFCFYVKGYTDHKGVTYIYDEGSYRIKAPRLKKLNENKESAHGK